MDMKLPKGKAILDNAQLQFVNFENVLHAGKRERAHKISGYISIIYPDSVDIIFLNQGEPFNAARIMPNERGLIGIKEVVEKARKADSGIISSYAVEPVLLEMILATLTQKPIKADIDTTKIQPKTLLDRLGHTKFNGFLWVRHNVDESFIRLEDGVIAGCYIGGRSGSVHDEDKIMEFLGLPHVRISVFDKTPGGNVSQATPSQLEMFVKVFTALHKEFGKALGAALVLRTSSIAKETSQREHSFLANFKINSDLSVVGEALVEPDILIKGFARWLDLIYESFSTFLGKDATKIVQEAIKDYRFALKAAKFFEHTKWKLE